MAPATALRDVVGDRVEGYLRHQGLCQSVPNRILAHPFRLLKRSDLSGVPVACADHEISNERDRVGNMCATSVVDARFRGRAACRCLVSCSNRRRSAVHRYS
jgi:hypothetical protein